MSEKKLVSICVYISFERENERALRPFTHARKMTGGSELRFASSRLEKHGA